MNLMVSVMDISNAFLQVVQKNCVVIEVPSWICVSITYSVSIYIVSTNGGICCVGGAVFPLLVQHGFALNISCLVIYCSSGLPQFFM